MNFFLLFLILYVRLVLQCIAVFKYKSHLLSSPAVPCVDRKKVKYVSTDIVQPPEGKGAAYVGKRTGTVIRSLYAGEELYTVCAQASLQTCGKPIHGPLIQYYTVFVRI